MATREMTAEQIQAAMQHARAALPAWQQTPLAERLRLLQQLRVYVAEHAEDIATEIARATGKVVVEALIHEVYLVIDAIHYYEKHAVDFLKRKKVKTPLVLFGNRSYIEYKPLGVVAVIAPWNFPFQLSMIPVISALAAGNCVLLKPSEVTPLVGVLIERIFQALPFPAGVMQVLHGGRDIGQQLCAAQPDKIFFTGSVATGQKIMAAAAEQLIPVDLELGGKDPMLVFADADLDRAASAAVWGAFTNAGQVCMSVERVYVEQSVYDAFVQKVLAKTVELRQGIDYGSMTFPPQLDLVQTHLQDALAKGAELLCGGQPLQEGTLYFAPTVLTGVDHTMRIMQEETFGPVLPIMPFATEAEAIALANDTQYGLNASVWSLDLAKAQRVCRQLISGNVCLNDVISTVGNPHLPFGGAKSSGIGRYHAAIGLHTFSHQTSVMMNKGKKPSEINWFPYSTELETAFYTLIRLLYGKTNRFRLAPVLNLMRVFLGTYRKK